MSLADSLAAFRTAIPARAMKRPPDNDDQVRLMTKEEGLVDLEVAEMEGLADFPTVLEEPRDGDAAMNNRLLWVVAQATLPVALESCDWGQQLESSVIKHSNLTGGAHAHSGGELWIVDGQGVLVNAGSGRYGADTEAELDEFLEVLRAMGLRVASMGFDAENPGEANRIAVGPITWLDPHE